MTEKMFIRCDQCEARGKLWLGGNDYLECPQCGGLGRLEVHQHKVQARARTIYIPGMKPFTVVDLPQRSLVSDSPIRRD